MSNITAMAILLLLILCVLLGIFAQLTVITRILEKQFDQILERIRESRDA